jgi:hypothetical protein
MMSVSPLQSWADSLPDPIPIEVSTDSSRDGEIRALLQEAPMLCNTPVAALMWLRIGRFEPAHSIVQDASRGLPAYIHGMLHRLEGDYWNANYWFRQTRDQELLASIQRYMTEHRASAPWGVDFQPSEFTQAVESLMNPRRPVHAGSLDELQQVAMLEWRAVWETAMKSVFFTPHDH